MSIVSKKIWGPATWTLIHSAAASCDNDSAPGFSAFLYSLTHVLPCPECRAHLHDYLQNHPPDEYIIDAQSASRFCFDLHNYVNTQTGKVSLPPRIIHTLYDVHLEDLDGLNTSRSRTAANATGARRTHRHRRHSFRIL